MGRDALTSSCEAFRLTIVRPETEEHAGAPEKLHGTVELAPDGAATSCRVALALFAHLTQRVGESGIAGEAPIAGSSVTVARAAGPAPFDVPFPASIARSYSGSHLRIDAGVLAESDDGNALRVVMPAAWESPIDASASVLFVRGLPLALPVARLGWFSFAFASLVVGAVLLVAGAVTDIAWMYQVGAVLVIEGAVLSLVKRKGVLGWLRVGQARATLDAHEHGLRVRVEAGPRAKGGRAALCATEYEIYDGSDTELCEVTRCETPLDRDADGSFVAVVRLPPPSEAPPSLGLRAAGRTVGIRWSAVLELDTQSGSIARFSLPLTVGIRKAP